MKAHQAICGIFLAAAVALASLPAWSAGPALPENPTIADKKAFLAAVLRYIDEHKFDPRDGAGVKRSPPACNEALNEVRQGNVTFLEPEAFDATKKPQAVLDIEKRCPKLDLGVTVEDGVRWTSTRNFALYLLPLGSPGITPVFYSERYCNPNGECNEDADYDLIDPDACVKEGEPISLSDSHNLSAFVRIGTDYFDMSANDSGTYGKIGLTHIPSRRPFPKNYEWFSCSIWPEVAR